MPFETSRRVFGASMFTLGYAAACAPAKETAVTTPSEDIVIEEVKYPAYEGYQMPAYVARPRSAAAAPAIIVVNEVFGIHAYIKDVCNRLAKLGYVAIAPAYFTRIGDPSTMNDVQKIITDVVAKAKQPQVLGDTAATIDFLKTQAYADANKIGITGFCWGGNVVWMSAAKVPGIKAGVAWYGKLTKPKSGWGSDGNDPWPVDIGGLLHVPVLGLYGGKDNGIPLADVESMRASLQAADNPSGSEIIVYPEAEHGFHADYRPSYNAEAAADGWARMQAWFKKHGVA